MAHSSVLDLKVRYKETDSMGRVYHSNYFVWFDMARTEYLREHGYAYKQMEADGLFFVVAETTCRYFDSLGFDDELQIVTTLSEIKNVSLKFEYTVFNKSTKKKICTASTKLGAVDKTGKIVKIPKQIINQLGLDSVN